MYISKVISFKNSWEFINKYCPVELQEVLDALDDFITGKVIIEADEGRLGSRHIWEKALYDRGWELIDRTHYSMDGRRINIGSMGPTKNGLSAQIPIGPIDNLSRWIFQQSALAVKHNLIKLPVLLVPVRDFSRKIGDRWIARESFEMDQGQLELLSPLSHQSQFLIIGYSDQAIIGDPEVIEIEADSYVDNSNKIIDRCIEFPPEYHQAGLDILNYFGTYLREQYPEQGAKIRIEQEGLNVRMIIEAENGRSEIIEKALHEYELIITGAEPPEKFTKNDKLILDLRNELRIVQFRLESQQDFIGLQNKRIDQLLDIVGNGLANKQPITIDFRPTITANSNVQINQNVSSALENINELLQLLPPASEASLAFSELEGSLESIEKNTDQESVKNSPVMGKFKRLMDKVFEEGNEISSVIKKTEETWEIFKDIAGKYNKLAQWCCLPQVPLP